MTALAHRALVAATLYDVAPRVPRVSARTTGGETADANVLVAVDDPPLDGAAFAAAREALAPDGIVAVVVSSTAAAGLLGAGVVRDPARDDAFARASAWAASVRAPLAPPVSASRLRAIAAAAAASGFALVEPEIRLLRSRPPRTAVDRAVVSVVLRGAVARPLLFVPERRAPKNRLAKLREERALDGWIEASTAPAAEPASLFDAALSALARHGGPMRGKDLLREARAIWTEAARSRGERVTLSASDGPTLAKALVEAWHTGTVELYAVDPRTTPPA
jgi:hypothetical protein